MSDERSVPDLDDILYELEGKKKAEGRIAQFFAGATPAVIRRSFRVIESKGPQPLVGRTLLTRCPINTQKRFETLLFVEEKLPPDDDHGYLIGPACQILESELDRLLMAPARGIAESLIAALRVAKKDRPRAEVLEGWASRQIPTTIGIGSLVLLALRRGWEQGMDPVIEFLSSHFGPGYRDLLTSKGLGRCLDAVRNQFRNPTCHGTAVFDATGYAEFARLVVANHRFAAWDALGPDPANPDAEIGILHHHLSHARTSTPESSGRIAPSVPAEEADPIAPLLALRTPASSPLEIRVLPHHAEESRDLREMDLLPARLDRPFRLGDTIRFGFQANRTCHVVLIDVGTSGTVAVVLPNAWCEETRIAGGRPYFLPAIDDPQFEFILTGRAGRERVVAIATLEPLAVSLPPEPGSPFRVLTAGEIRSIADAVSRGRVGWATAGCDFVID